MLIRELEAADIVVIATPMHNYTVPAVLKAWIDHIVRIHRTFASTPAGKVGKLPDRPVYLVVASGGWFTQPSPVGTPPQPDFLTPYLRAVLGTIGLHTVTVLPLEGVTRGPDAVAAAWARATALLDAALPVKRFVTPTCGRSRCAPVEERSVMSPLSPRDRSRRRRGWQGSRRRRGWQAVASHGGDATALRRFHHLDQRERCATIYAASAVCFLTRGITSPLINSIERSTLRFSSPPMRVQHSNSSNPKSTTSCASFSAQ